MKLQQKPFDNMNLNKILKDIYTLFPLKYCTISIAYNYPKPISSKIFNYRQTAF